MPIDTVPPILLSQVHGAMAVGAGLLLGLGAAVPPGPVNLEIARRVARDGFRAGASVGFGAVTVDVFFALLLSLGALEVINNLSWLRLAVSIFGIGLLAWLGMGALRNAAAHVRGRATPASPVTATPVRPAHVGFVTGALMCLTSPMQALFWLTAVPAVMAELLPAASAGGEERGIVLQGVLVCVGVFVATFLWVVSFSAALEIFRGLDRKQWLPVVMDLVGGVVLLGFAAHIAWKLGSGVL